MDHSHLKQRHRAERAGWHDNLNLRVHRFVAAKRVAGKALGQRDTVKVLGIALSRLYTLRNQLIHGGATWSSKVNRVQLRDGVNLLGKLVPIVIETMMDHRGTIWGDPCYPIVDPKG